MNDLRAIISIINIMVFLMEMLLLKVVVLKFWVEEKQIVFHQNCFEIFCFLMKKCNQICVLFLVVVFFGVNVDMISTTRSVRPNFIVSFVRRVIQYNMG